MITSRRDFLAWAIAPLAIFLDVPEMDLPPPAPPVPPALKWRVTQELFRDGSVREVRHQDFRTDAEMEDARALLALLGTPEDFDADTITITPL